MSASVGAVFCVAMGWFTWPSVKCCIRDVKDLLHDLLHRGQRVELPPLDFVQQTPQLRVIRNRTLEMSLRAPGRDGEDLTGQIAAPPLLEPSFSLEMRAVLLDLLPELRHVLVTSRLGEDDRRTPRPVTVEGQARAHLVQHRLRSW